MPLFFLLLLGAILWLAPRYPDPKGIAKQVAMEHVALELSNKDIYKINRRIFATDKEDRNDRLDRYVVARLIRNGRNFPVEVRNRGSFGYHKYYDRKSWRLRSPFNQTVFPGVVRFNLSRSRYPLFEDHLAYTLARKVRQPAPESFPILFSLNGDWQGVYHFTEQTDELFLRRNRLPYGPIFGDYKRHERELTTVGTVYGRSGRSKRISPWTNGFDDIRNTLWQYLSLRELEDTGKAPPLDSLLRYLYFDDHRFEEATFNQLDLAACLRWHGLQVLFGSAHSDVHNLRLYYNPARDGFQFFTWDPLPFHDYAAHRHMPGWWVPMGNILLLRLNEIPEYGELRNRVTYRLLMDEIPETRVLQLVEELYPRLREIYENDPDRAYLDPLASGAASNRHFSLDEFDLRYRALKTWIMERYEFLTKYLGKTGVKGIFRSQAEDNITRIIIEKTGDSGAVLEQIRFSIGPERGERDPNEIRLYFDSNHNHRLDPSDREISLSKRVIMGSSTGNRMVLELKKPFVFLTEKRLVHQNRAGKGLVEYPGKDGTTEMLMGNVRQPVPFPTYFSFLLKAPEWLEAEGKDRIVELGISNSVTGKTGQVKLKRFQKIQNSDKLIWGWDRRESLARWLAAGFSRQPPPQTIVWDTDRILDSTFVVAPHQVLKILPGCTIRFTNTASLMVFGRLEAVGTGRAPIRFVTGADPVSAKQKAGMGWVIAINNGEAVFDHVSLDGGGEAIINHIPYTGAISAYNSQIEVKNSRVSNSRGDDGINVKYGEAVITGSRFSGNIDAIDCDYSRCTVRNSVFINNSNDGIDIGSGFTTIDSNTVRGSGDKGISIGGYSTVEVRDCVVSDNRVGLAVKDGSRVTLGSSSLERNGLGIALFVKNKKFKLSKPTITLENGTRVNNNRRNLFRKENTALIVDGGEIAKDPVSSAGFQFDYQSLYE